MSNGAAIPIPANWDQLTDDEKDAVTAEMLKRLADENGIPRGSGSRTGSGRRSGTTRSFTKPE